MASTELSVLSHHCLSHVFVSCPIFVANFFTICHFVFVSDQDWLVIIVWSRVALDFRGLTQIFDFDCLAVLSVVGQLDFFSHSKLKSGHLFWHFRLTKHLVLYIGQYFNWLVKSSGITVVQNMTKGVEHIMMLG